MTAAVTPDKMPSMRKTSGIGVIFAILALSIGAVAQKDTEEEPTAVVSFLVLKDDNGKPVRNAAVIMHPVNSHGKQGRGGVELKTDAEGKSSFDGIPYGKLRVQILASGFQTYGEDFDVSQPKLNLTIKLKRPQGQYSIYDDHAKDQDVPKQESPPPAEKKSEKPN
jgi:Carboxypeptidase regulatory-like domain